MTARDEFPFELAFMIGERKHRRQYEAMCALIDRLRVELDAANRDNERLRADLDRIGLAYIEASNPGIDMEEVRRLRGSRT